MPRSGPPPRGKRLCLLPLGGRPGRRDGRFCSGASNCSPGGEAELDACYEGQTRHPVFVALRETIERYQIPQETVSRIC